MQNRLWIRNEILQLKKFSAASSWSTAENCMDANKKQPCKTHENILLPFLAFFFDY